ncbi:MAG TPA: ATP-binding protein, partial [Nitrospira sp.]|nr:ATP-binding protein [Nitrospira sp.]
RIHTVLDARTGLVCGDPDRLHQVLVNLLSNAVKFTPCGGWISVHLKRVGANAEIGVEDAGAGIAEEFLPHVFERFRQAHEAANVTRGGLGVGLAIVRHLVEMHGGSVKGESEGKGCGATFTVSLPLLEGAVRMQGSQETQPGDVGDRPGNRSPTLSGLLGNVDIHAPVGHATARNLEDGVRQG